ncbi:MAG: SRPBCC family protein [Halobacteriota archaeon]
MPRFEAETTVAGSLEELVAFHTDTDGLVELTPRLLRPRVSMLRGDRSNLREGDEFVFETRPLGLGPTQRFHAEIMSIEREDDRFVIEDAAVDGPFEHWRHRHRLERTLDGTRVVDEIRYHGPPGGSLGTLFAPVALRLLFRYRHRRLHQRFGRPPEV